MPTYISLISYTQKGIENIKESPKRLDQAKEMFRAAGAELKEFYLVTGKYDQIVITEVPDEETVAKLALSTAAQGSIRSETLRAFTEEEYRKIVASLT